MQTRAALRAKYPTCECNVVLLQIGCTIAVHTGPCVGHGRDAAVENSTLSLPRQLSREGAHGSEKLSEEGGIVSNDGGSSPQVKRSPDECRGFFLFFSLDFTMHDHRRRHGSCCRQVQVYSTRRSRCVSTSLHTVGSHFDLVHDVLIHNAVHIGEAARCPRCEGGHLPKMARSCAPQ